MTVIAIPSVTGNGAWQRAIITQRANRQTFYTLLTSQPPHVSFPVETPALTTLCGCLSDFFVVGAIDASGILVSMYMMYYMTLLMYDNGKLVHSW
jgi:hypothetical protein